MLSPQPIEEAIGSSDALAAWNAVTLASLEGEAFDVLHHGGQVEPLTLISVTCSPGLAREGGREPFSLIFRSGLREVHFSQGCRTLRHAVLGVAEVFLVPIGPDGSGMRYEAVFN